MEVGKSIFALDKNKKKVFLNNNNKIFLLTLKIKKVTKTHINVGSVIDLTVVKVSNFLRAIQPTVVPFRLFHTEY